MGRQPARGGRGGGGGPPRPPRGPPRPTGAPSKTRMKSSPVRRAAARTATSRAARPASRLSASRPRKSGSLRITLYPSTNHFTGRETPLVRGAAGASGPRDSGDVVGGGEPVPPGDPCFGYRVGPGYESVHADRRDPSSICVVDRGRRLATPDASRVLAAQGERPRAPREEALDAGAPVVPGGEVPET